jgi:hypothetical protein
LRHDVGPSGRESARRWLSQRIPPAAAARIPRQYLIVGTTGVGGDSVNNAYGTVFKLTPPDWTETVLYSFTGGSDGGSPAAGLIADNRGALYGTAGFGGMRALQVILQMVVAQFSS